MLEEVAVRFPPNTDSKRRSLLKFLAGGAVVIGTGLWNLLPACARQAIASRFRTNTVEKKNFRFDPARGEIVWKDGRREPYRLVLDGLVETPASLTYAQLRALPQLQRTIDFHCVEGWSVENVPWGGVAYRDLFAKVKISPQAKYAVFHALGQTESLDGLTHYVESLPLRDLMNPAMNTLLALDMDGAPLTDERGAPARAVSPFDLGYKGCKFVTRVEFTAEPTLGWWTRANPIYGVYAPVEKSRLRTPDPRGG